MLIIRPFQCDGEDTPDLESGYFPTPATSLDGRTLELQMDDRGVAWGTIRAGRPGDEVWIDRSWDPDTLNLRESLGRVSIPEDEGRADTKGFVTRDVRLHMYGGAVRACGKAGKHSFEMQIVWSS